MSDESTKKKPNNIRERVSAQKTDFDNFPKNTPKDKHLRAEILAKQKAAEAEINEDDVISDDAIGGIDFFDAPGALRGTSKLILETRKAQMIFDGRKPDKKKNKPFIIGLNSFAAQLRIIYDQSGEGDPYADYWLIKVERELVEKTEIFESIIKDYTKILGQYENITHEVAHSIKPITKHLRFSIAYSFQGAMMLMKLDQLIRTVMTANHVGLVETHVTNREIRIASKQARNTFESVIGYRFCDVKRDDIAANNPKAQRAQELMGGCPSAILEDEIAPKFVSSKAMYLKSERSRKSAESFGK